MSSDYTQLLQGVVTELQAIPSAPNVVLRKKLVIVSGDTVPIWIVAPGKGGEKIFMHTFPGPTTPTQPGVIYDYPVVIALVYAVNELLTTDLTTNLDTRIQVRDALYGIVTGTPNNAFDLRMDPEEVTDFGALLGSSYDVTGFSFVYRTDELMAV